MKPKIGIIFAVITLGFSSTSALAQPATVRFIPGNGQSFWITNNTDKTLLFELNSIEVQQGSQWKLYSRPTGRGPDELYFHRTRILQPGSNNSFLAPHEACYGSLMDQSISLPGKGVWRAQITVEEELTGKEEIAAAMKYPLPPFSMHRATYWGNPQEIYSEVHSE